MSCSHLADAAAEDVTVPTGGFDGCPDCHALDSIDWVHLRACLACGNVGCCDSSPYRHATAHHERTGHPVMRSVQPGESWRWCYLDEEIG